MPKPFSYYDRNSKPAKWFEKICGRMPAPKGGYLANEAKLTDRLEKSFQRCKDPKKAAFLYQAYLYGAHLGD